MGTHSLRIYKTFIPQIRSGQKTLEVRIGYPFIRLIQVNDHIHLSQQEPCRVRVTHIRAYPDFVSMLKEEPHMRIAPDAHSANEVLRGLRAIYMPDKEQLGVIVFQIKYLP